MEAATGERIVAFGRAGKRPETAFLWAPGAGREGGRWLETSDDLQRFLKPHQVGLGARGTSDMALGTKKRETRKSLQQSGWITQSRL